MDRIRVSTGIFSLRSAISQLLLLLVVCLAFSAPANAQSTAALNGTVTDATGASVPNAKVVLRNTATSVEWTSQTDGAGAYLFPSLPIGLYRVEVSAPSFQTTVINGLQLQVATAVTKDIQLQLGQVTQQVVITSEAPIVETATNGVGQVLNDKTVQEIPLNGRHFVDLGLLTAGTVTPPQNGFLTAPLRGQGSFAIDTAGNREDTTNWLINGINLNDPVQNQVTFQPPVDTLAEIKIDNSSFPAQYGRNSGSVVNLATRSGSNEFHGEAFDFFRNNVLDARNFFNPTFVTKSGVLTPNPQNPFQRNDFGADFGGPIIRNKLFFFIAYEGLRQNQAIPLSTFVPSVNQLAMVTSPSIHALVAAGIIPAANGPGTDADGNPANFNGFIGSTAAHVALNQGSADLDYEWTASNRFHFYYVLQKDLREEPTQGANLPGFGDTRDGFRQLMTISEDHIFSPSMTNTVRLGFNRIHLFFTPTALNPADFDITLPPGSPEGVGIPNIVVSGAMAFGGPTGEPQGRGDTTVVLNDTLSWLKGRHDFAFGGEIRRAYNNNVAENVGSFSFTSLQNFVMDSASAFTVLEGAGNDRILEPSYGVFAQDSYKWKPNFTINIGLRYEWNSTPSEAENRFTTFDLATGSLIPAPQPFHTNNKNFEPRIGFAWDPFKDGKTSVRAAYAIMTQDPTTNVVTPLSSSPPFAVPISVNAANITLENPSAAIVGVSLGPTIVNPNFDNAYAQDWNLTIERQLNATMGLQVAYVGMKGTHLQLTENLNQPFVTDGLYGDTRPFPTLPLSSPILPAQCAPPNPQCTLGTISNIDSPGNSNYNALWVTLTKHLSNGLEFVASYTYSKSFDYSSVSSGDAVPVQNSFNPRGDYGLSEFDARHRFVLSGFYELPFKKGNRLLGGWEIGAVTQLQSGNPMTPLVQVNLGPQTFNLRPDAVGPATGGHGPAQFYNFTAKNGLCENYNGPTTPITTLAVPDCATDTSAVLAIPCTFNAGAKPATQTLILGSCHPGDIKRDGLPGPDFINTDFSLVKTTKLTERFKLQFRAEMFDVFNHPNFGNPGNVLSSSSALVPTSFINSFGTITSTRFTTGDFGSSRQMQLALKLMF
jgi:hypothetical protein